MFLKAVLTLGVSMVVNYFLSPIGIPQDLQRVALLHLQRGTRHVDSRALAREQTHFIEKNRRRVTRSWEGTGSHTEVGSKGSTKGTWHTGVTLVSINFVF